MNAIESVDWAYEHSYASENRKTRRTGTIQDPYRLVGIDGFLDGGLRPHPGFQKVRDLAGASSSDPVQTGLFEAVTLRLGASAAANGYVYRTLNGTTWSYKFEYTLDDGATWETPVTLLTGSMADGYGQVSSVGLNDRSAYLFVKGQTPVLFYFEETDPVGNPGVFTLQTVVDPGPGTPPLMRINEATAGSLDNDGGDFDGLNVAQVVLTSSAPTGPANSADAELLPARDYAFAWYGLNATTGRRSALSEIKVARAVTDFTSSTADNYIEFEANVADEYDRVVLLRSAGSRSDQNDVALGDTLFVEADFLVADFDVESPPADTVKTGFTKVRYAVALSDKALKNQDIWRNRASFLSDLPKGGAAKVYEGIQVVSSIEDEATAGNSVGEIRFSGTADPSVELFPVLNRTVPADALDDIINFEVVGSTLIGFSESRLLLGRAEGGLLDFYPVHTGFGTVAVKGAAPVSEELFFVTTKGFKTVDSAGNLNMYANLDDLVIREWNSDIEDVFLAFDPETACVYCVNAKTDSAALVWVNNGRTTELYDLPFVTGGTGRSVLDGNVRAQFVTADGVVFQPDNLRQNTNNFRLFDLEDVASQTTQLLGGTITNSNTIAFQAGQIDGDFSGFYGRVVSDDGYGTQLKVATVDTDTGVVTFEGTPLTGLTGTVQVSFGGVYVRYEGYLLRGNMSGQLIENDAMAAFRTRHVQFAQCMFTDVAGPLATNEYTRWRASLLRGNSDTPFSSAFPSDVDGNRIASVLDDDVTRGVMFEDNADDGNQNSTGNRIYPMIELVAMGFDFNLVASIFKGRLLGNDAWTARDGESVG